MNKPTEEDLETTRSTLEYLIASCQEHEPFAVNTIAEWEAAMATVPCDPDDIEEVS
mgnify:CR=1 FL=1|tara:strand:- start:83 stop:250 length:168 start_codon:yes stop_codon:yes gene_type:complete